MSKTSVSCDSLAIPGPEVCHTAGVAFRARWRGWPAPGPRSCCPNGILVNTVASAVCITSE
jgi:hypothetical protein